MTDADEVRRLRERVAELETALRQARGPIAIAASYAGEKDLALGLRIHARDCGKALAAIDAALRLAGPVLAQSVLDRVYLDCAVARIEAWTHVYGAALVPPGADTYGEGMRDAKAQVSALLAPHPALPPSEKERG